MVSAKKEFNFVNQNFNVTWRECQPLPQVTTYRSITITLALGGFTGKTPSGQVFIVPSSHSQSMFLVEPLGILLVISQHFKLWYNHASLKPGKYSAGKKNRIYLSILDLKSLLGRHTHPHQFRRLILCFFYTATGKVISPVFIMPTLHTVPTLALFYMPGKYRL